MKQNLEKKKRSSSLFSRRPDCINSCLLSHRPSNDSLTSFSLLLHILFYNKTTQTAEWILRAPRPVIITMTQLKPSHCPNCWSVFDCGWKSSFYFPMLWFFSWSGPRRTAEQHNTNTLSALHEVQSLLLTHEVNKTLPRECSRPLFASGLFFFCTTLKKKQKWEKHLPILYKKKKQFQCLEHKCAHLWNYL